MNSDILSNMLKWTSSVLPSAVPEGIRGMLVPKRGGDGINQHSQDVTEYGPQRYESKSNQNENVTQCCDTPYTQMR